MSHWDSDFREDYTRERERGEKKQKKKQAGIHNAKNIEGLQADQRRNSATVAQQVPEHVWVKKKSRSCRSTVVISSVSRHGVSLRLIFYVVWE